MLSLAKTNLSEIVKKQYFHKLRANIDSFSALIGIQALAILFSFGGVGSSGMSGSGMSITVRYYSSDVVFAFTIIWAFVTAITVNTKSNSIQDFTFVTNRLSSSLSNILFLATTGLLGSITAILSGYLINVILFLFTSKTTYTVQNGMDELVIGIGVAFLYIFLASSIGFFISSVTSISRLFIFLIPVLVIGVVVAGEALLGIQIINKLIQFYGQERSIPLFIVKALATAGFFFTAGISILRTMEVKR